MTPGGGWGLACAAGEISIGDVCRALQERLLFAIDFAAPSGCAVQAAVTGVMDGFLDDAEHRLLERLDRISIADLSSQVRSARTSHAERGKRQ